MLKSIEALLRGYYKFEVNEEVFYLYHKALDYRKYLTNRKVNVMFSGRHIFYKHDRLFYLSFHNDNRGNK